MPAKSNRWQRDRMVIGILCGSVVAKMNFTCSGGSSSVFRSALNALLREHVNFVDDVYFVSRAAWPHRHVLPQLAELSSTSAVARAVDFQHVDVIARGDADANVALVAGRGRRSANAIERLGENAGGRSLPHAARPGEKIRVPDAVAGDGLLQGAGDVLLAHQFIERLRPISPGDDDVSAGRQTASVDAGDRSLQADDFEVSGVQCIVDTCRTVIGCQGTGVLTPEI